MEVEWHKIISFNGSQANAFEELVCQIAMEEKSDECEHFERVGTPDPDMKSFSKLAQIPNTVAKDFFEAPFMFKRNEIYYLTYSSGRCEDGTYRVQYVMSKTGPMGPFVFGKNNPVLSTNADGTMGRDINRFYRKVVIFTWCITDTIIPILAGAFIDSWQPIKWNSMEKAIFFKKK